MFLRKAIKSFGLLALIFCISVSTQNEIIAVKAANNSSETELDNYVTKIHEGDTLKIDTLSIIFDPTSHKVLVKNESQDTHYHYKVTVASAPSFTPLIGAGKYQAFPGNAKDVEITISKIKCDKTSSMKKQELSCTTDGIITYTCTCGNKYDEITKAPGHTYVTKQTNYPTVYNAGTMDLYCTKCSEETVQEIPQYEFNVSIGGSQLKAIRLGHKLLFANTHKAAKYIPFVVPNGKSVFDVK